MKIIKELPEGYKRVAYVNLQKDKKLSTIINFISLLIALIMAVPMHFYIPITTLFDFSLGMEGIMMEIVILLIAMTAYIILHEAVHGVVMKFYGCEKLKFGFTGLYAFAGTDELIPKKPYKIIAVAPVIFWGIILLIVLFFTPEKYFWIVYLLVIVNISGAVGDIFVTLKFSKMPDDIYIHDNGVSMNIYSKEDYKEEPAEKEYEI